MKMYVFGITRKESVNQNTGVRTVYSNLHGYGNFTQYEIEHGAQGQKGMSINTSLDTTGIQIGDTISVSYEPTGFKDKNGSPQFRIAELEVIATSKK